MAESDKESGRELKVSDRRMFTATGELREEYRDLEEAADRAAADAGAAARPAPRPDAADAPGEAEPEEKGAASGAAPPTEPLGGAGEPAAGRPIDMPQMPGGVQQLSFMDLIGALAEPATVYLGEAELPDGRDVTDLRLARHYIDLLDVLRRKTAGNLSAQEASVLEDVLYRLRMRYVQKQE